MFLIMDDNHYKITVCLEYGIAIADNHLQVEFEPGEGEQVLVPRVCLFHKFNQSMAVEFFYKLEHVISSFNAIIILC